jgi:hypothetical protein
MVFCHFLPSMSYVLLNLFLSKSHGETSYRVFFMCFRPVPLAPVLRIRDVYFGSWILIFYVSRSHKFHKIENHYSFEMLKKEIWANFQRIIELFTQKIVTKLSKIWVWDPGYGINLFQIPDPGPGVKKALDQQGSATLLGTAGT